MLKLWNCLWNGNGSIWLVLSISSSLSLCVKHGRANEMCDVPGESVVAIGE